MKAYGSFQSMIKDAERRLLELGYDLPPGRWQGIDVAAKPDMGMREYFDFDGKTPVLADLGMLRFAIAPNMPWADEHFGERVGRRPVNPGVTWKRWPWAHSADRFRTESDAFTHTYMERYWPTHAGHWGGYEPARGLRYTYGDLDSVVELLKDDPGTRQAYLPIFFPEDTGALHRGRVPCSLGYHFMMRHAHMHVSYYLRSCDIVRHFRDDLYLTARLLLWVLEELRRADRSWSDVRPGMLLVHVGSLHCFRNDLKGLQERARS